MRIRAIAACAALTFGPAAAMAAGQPFYAGKTITFVVGVQPGGSSDISCRLLAQFLPAHIAGQPTIIVKNVPSADNVLATNYVVDQKNDGLTLRCGAIAPTNQPLGIDTLKVDLSKMNYILGDGGPEVMYVRTDILPGKKTAQDVFAAKDLVLPGFSVDGAKDWSERLLLDTAGLKYKYVTGFQGGGAIDAAFQQKFVNLAQDSLLAYVSTSKKTVIDTGIATPLYQTGVADSKGEMTARDSQLPDVPSFAEFYKAHFGKMPSGESWDLGSKLLLSNNVALSVLALPPGASKDAVTAMRGAVAPLNHDAGFLAAAEKLRGKNAEETSWQEVSKRISDLVNLPPTEVAFLKQLIETGRQIQQKQ